MIADERCAMSGPNLDAKHRATYVRLLDLPRHKWEPSRASQFPLSHEPRHRAAIGGAA